MIVENTKTHNIIRKDSGTIERIQIYGNVRSCMFSRVSTRFDIIVTKLDNDREDYLVSLPNYYFCIVTSRPHDIGYKLIERRVMSAVDAESVEMGIKYLMNIEKDDEKW